MNSGYDRYSNFCIGIILFGFGILFFLGTTGVWPEFTFSKYWPLFFIVLGLHLIICPCNDTDSSSETSPAVKTKPAATIAKTTSKPSAKKKTTSKKKSTTKKATTKSASTSSPRTTKKATKKKTTTRKKK